MESESILIFSFLFRGERAGFFFGQKLLDHKKPGSPQLPMSKNRRTNNSSFFGGRGVSPSSLLCGTAEAACVAPNSRMKKGGAQILAFLLSQESLNKNPTPAASKWRPRKEIRPFLLGRLRNVKVDFSSLVKIPPPVRRWLYWLVYKTREKGKNRRRKSFSCLKKAWAAWIGRISPSSLFLPRVLSIYCPPPLAFLLYFLPFSLIFFRRRIPKREICIGVFSSFLSPLILHEQYVHVALFFFFLR